MDHVNTENKRPFLTSREVARLLRVSADKVLGWIHRGDLRAVNVSNRVRPQYRVSAADLDAFLKEREVQPPPKRSQRKSQEPEGGPLDPALGEALLKKRQAVKVGKEYYRIWNGMILFY
jgi:excisionase family DNA binding protein